MKCNKSLSLVYVIDLHLVCIDNFPVGFLAADLTLGLRRIPGGFYVTVQADGAEWRTTNKNVDIDQYLVEWHERMLL